MKPRSTTRVVGLWGTTTIRARGRGLRALEHLDEPVVEVLVRSPSSTWITLAPARTRREEVNRIRRRRHDRRVAWLDEHPHQMGETLLRADRRDRLRLGIELDAEAIPVQVADRLAQLRDAAARRVAVVVRLRGCLGELLDRHCRRGEVGVAEAKVDRRRPRRAAAPASTARSPRTRTAGASGTRRNSIGHHCIWYTGLASMSRMAKTLFERIWERHLVAEPRGEPALALRRSAPDPRGHLAPGLRRSPPRRPAGPAARSVARDDGSQRPDRGGAGHRSAREGAARRPAPQLRRSSASRCYATGSGREGIVHVIGPELGLTQPGMTIVCGDSHTSTHGAFGALAFGVGTSEVEHVLATQCLPQQRPRTMRVRFDGELPPSVTAKDMILGAIGRLGVAGGIGHVLEYTGAGDPRPLDGEPDDDLQHVDRGRCAGGDDRARRHDVRLSRGPARGADRGRVGAGTRRLAHARVRSRCDLRQRVRDRCRRARPAGHMGHEPGDGRLRHGPRPGSGRLRRSRPAAARRACAHLHGPRARHGDAGHLRRPGLHRLVHERPDRGSARGSGRGRRQAGRIRACARSSCPARRRSRGWPRTKGSTGSSSTPGSSGGGQGARCASA